MKKQAYKIQERIQIEEKDISQRPRSFVTFQIGVRYVPYLLVKIIGIIKILSGPYLSSNIM